MAKKETGGKSRTGSGSSRMRDVAERAGVSPMTVSRALKGTGKVSAKTREHVLAVVHDMGYLPNNLASSLSSNRSTTIGLIVPSIDNSIYTQTIKGLSDVLRRSGFQLMIAESGYDPLVEEQIILTFLAQRVSGLVLHNTEHTAHAIAQLRKSGVPVVENGNLPSNPIDMAVSYSNRDAAFAMTTHLGRLGYKQIAFVSLSSVNNERSRDRLLGYREALQAMGRSYDARLVVETGRGLGGGADALSRILQTAPETDALFCAGDVLAAGALFECQRRSIAVPGRLAIASFDDVDLLKHVTPPITTLRLPRYEIGERTAQMLLGRITGHADTLHGNVVDLRFEVIQRESA
ncbi:LacI family DNA-binding transcriptional regulator [Ensifer soli]|uniref:LacI family DNA-binding transcriptional regulator n=1 Tax=Ciceribacter sp. sgz301302 TaxID=3342379 RepID=UPI0035B7956F